LVINDRSDARGGTSLLAAIRELRATRYDVVFDLQGLLKSALLARSTGAPRVIGFSSRYARESVAPLFYTQAFDPGRGGIYDARETRHVVDINLAMLDAIGLTAATAEFPIDPVRSAVADSVQAATGGAYALLNPGAAWPNKRWPPERFGALARALKERHGLMSAVLWGPGEESLASAAVAASSGAAFQTDPTSVADVVALARA